MKRGSDRLSNLPDSVLVEILSLLKAREVVQTCVLSKRWLKLWTSVPCLDFDTNDFCTEEFKKFVSRFLDLRDDCVNTDKFVLRYVVPYIVHPPTKISRSAKRWILYALKHKPKNLRIEVEATDENLPLPEQFFTCESLEEAHLSIFDKVAYLSCFNGNSGYKTVPDRVSLPNLKTIHLSHMSIEKECMEKILSGCPILKRLSLVECHLAMGDILFQNLEFLTIDGCNFHGESNHDYCLISAPNLEKIELVGEIDVVLKLENMSKVKKAIILCRDYVSGSDFLSSFNGIADLHLSVNQLGKMLEEIPPCTMFYSLKILTLDNICVFCDFGSISSFLARCPNLEELVLIHNEREHYRDHVTLEKIFERTEMFCCERLKLVNIRCGLHEDVRGVEEFFLHFTKGLEGIEVVITRRPF